jgi:hypothetical protein
MHHSYDGAKQGYEAMLHTTYCSCVTQLQTGPCAATEQQAAQPLGAEH